MVYDHHVNCITAIYFAIVTVTLILIVIIL